MKKETITVRYEKAADGFWHCFLNDSTYTEDIPVPKMLKFFEGVNNAANILNKE